MLCSSAFLRAKAMSVKKTVIELVKKLPGGLDLLCFINEKISFVKYGGLPVEENKIVFTNYMGKGFGCNCRPVAEELLRRGGDYDMVWAVSDPEAQRADFPEGIRLVRYGSAEMMYEYATAKYWVCNYHLVDLFGHGLRKKEGQYYIQMWHGSFGIKKQERDVDKLTADKVWVKFSKMNSQNTDYWISNCKFENDVYRRSFWDVKNIMEFGHPRNDIFFQPHPQVKRAVREWLGLDDGTRFLLYIPTYRDDMGDDCYRVDFEKLVRALEHKTGQRWKVVVRLHPKLTDKAAEYVPFADCIIDGTGYPDITCLLASADAALTDYSSAIFDFMLSRNPAFIFATDIEKYNNDRGFYYDIYSTPFPVAVNNRELIENVLHFDYPSYRRKVEAFLEQKGSFEDGHAAERVADLIEKL